MNLTFYMYIAAALVLIAFFPDIFPQCSHCRWFKPVLLFKIHKNISFKLGYSANKSICKKCCRRYNINTFKDLKQLEAIKKKAEMELEKSKWNL